MEYADAVLDVIETDNYNREKYEEAVWEWAHNSYVAIKKAFSNRIDVAYLDMFFLGMAYSYLEEEKSAVDFFKKRNWEHLECIIFLYFAGDQDDRYFKQIAEEYNRYFND